MVNTQPIEKREPSYDGLLDVHSIFRTIQGEGPFCGTPCVFIRLAGCNLQCPGCDTDYTSERTLMTPAEIRFVVDGQTPRTVCHGRLVVITGGEPFRQHIGDLITLLINSGYYVQVESNGTLKPSLIPWNQDVSDPYGAFLVVSPKTGKINSIALQEACCLKYVVRYGNIAEDGLPITALDHSVKTVVARPPKNWHRPIYIQPMDEKDDERNKLNYQQAVECCLDHGYLLQIQVHKIVGVD